MGDMSNTAARIANGESVEEALGADRDLCPGCGNPVSEQERLTGVCGKDGDPIDQERSTVTIDVERERRILAEAEIDPDALLPDPDVVEREGVGDPGDVETEGWT